MSRVIYLDRNGERMQGDEWIRLSKDESYAQVALYDNGAVRLLVRWIGKINNPTDTFPSCYKLFAMRVFNYSDGKLVPDPVMDGKTFADEPAAVAAYQEFLETWTESHRDDKGEFVEEDNIFTPPPPPNPDAPASDAATVKGLMDDGVGAW